MAIRVADGAGAAAAADRRDPRRGGAALPRPIRPARRVCARSSSCRCRCSCTIVLLSAQPDSFGVGHHRQRRRRSSTTELRSQLARHRRCVLVVGARRRRVRRRGDARASSPTRTSSRRGDARASSDTWRRPRSSRCSASAVLVALVVSGGHGVVPASPGLWLQAACSRSRSRRCSSNARRVRARSAARSTSRRRTSGCVLGVICERSAAHGRCSNIGLDAGVRTSVDRQYGSTTRRDRAGRRQHDRVDPHDAVHCGGRGRRSTSTCASATRRSTCRCSSAGSTRVARRARRPSRRAVDGDRTPARGGRRPGRRTPRPRDILGDRRFDAIRRPARFARRSSWLGDRSSGIGDLLGDMLPRGAGAGVARARGRRRSSASCSSSRVVVRGRRARRARRQAGCRRRRGRRPKIPTALERAADAAERGGDLERAVRLRFRAGLLRLGAAARSATGRRSPPTRCAARSARRPSTSSPRTFEASRTAARPPNRPMSTPRGASGRACSTRRAEVTPTPVSVTSPRDSSRTSPPMAAVGSPSASSIVGAIVALNLLAHGLDRAVGGSEPSGQPGSSYATTAAGLAAYSTLLTATVIRCAVSAATRRAPRSTRPRRRSCIEPATLTGDDDAALLAVRHRRRAARHRRIRSVLPRTRCATIRPTSATRASAIHERSIPRAALRTVRTAGDGAVDDPGSGSVLVHAGDERAARRANAVGRGEIFFLADSSPLENAYLDRADNAAFALGLAGEPDRPVAFAEGVHGYGAAHAASARSRPAGSCRCSCLGARRVVFAWAAGRRFGPPDRPTPRAAAAARRVRRRAVDHARTHASSRGRARAVCSMGTRDRIATARLLRATRRREEIDRAASALGLTEPSGAALWSPPTNDDDALALGGRVVARRQPRRGGASIP